MNKYISITLIMFLFSLLGCKKDEPGPENCKVYKWSSIEFNNEFIYYYNLDNKFIKSLKIKNGDTLINSITEYNGNSAIHYIYEDGIIISVASLIINDYGNIIDVNITDTAGNFLSSKHIDYNSENNPVEINTVYGSGDSFRNSLTWSGGNVESVLTIKTTDQSFISTWNFTYYEENNSSLKFGYGNIYFLNNTTPEVMWIFSKDCLKKSTDFFGTTGTNLSYEYDNWGKVVKIITSGSSGTFGTRIEYICD